MTDESTKPQDALLGLVIDESGSMMHLYSSTIEGVNEFLKSQRDLPAKTVVSTVLFANNVDVRHVAVDINEIPVFGGLENGYSPSGGTALFDAVRTTIEGLDAWHVKHPEFTGKTIVTIMSDGEENCSRSTRLPQLNALMAARKEAGWEFIFLGAGEDAWTQAGQFTSLSQNVAYAASPQGNLAGYATASFSNSAIRGGSAIASNVNIP